MTGKRSILVCNNGKLQSTIPHASICALTETSINQGQEGLTKFYSMFVENFKESYRVHTCPEVATTHKREEWIHHPCGAVVTETEDSNLDYKDSVIPPLIYLEESENEDSMIEPPSADPTLDPRRPRDKPTKELTLVPNSNALSEPFAPTREDSMGHLAPKYIVR